MDRAKYKELQDLWIGLVNSIDANYEDVKSISVYPGYPKFNVEFDNYQFNNYVFGMTENLRQETLRVFGETDVYQDMSSTILLPYNQLVKLSRRYNHPIESERSMYLSRTRSSSKHHYYGLSGYQLDEYMLKTPLTPDIAKRLHRIPVDLKNLPEVTKLNSVRRIKNPYDTKFSRQRWADIDLVGFNDGTMLLIQYSDIGYVDDLFVLNEQYTPKLLISQTYQNRADIDLVGFNDGTMLLIQYSDIGYVDDLFVLNEQYTPKLLISQTYQNSDVAEAYYVLNWLQGKSTQGVEVNVDQGGCGLKVDFSIMDFRYAVSDYTGAEAYYVLNWLQGKSTQGVEVNVDQGGCGLKVDFSIMDFRYAVSDYTGRVGDYSILPPLESQDADKPRTENVCPLPRYELGKTQYDNTLVAAVRRAGLERQILAYNSLKTMSGNRTENVCPLPRYELGKTQYDNTLVAAVRRAGLERQILAYNSLKTMSGNAVGDFRRLSA